MSKIKPFHAILYDTQKAGDISTLITPPYDVIPASEIDTYYTYSPFNIIRLIRGKQEPGDNKHTTGISGQKGFSASGWRRESSIRSKVPVCTCILRNIIFQVKLNPGKE